MVTLLHGVYGSHWAWFFKGKAHVTLQRLVDEGSVPPMLLVTPSDGLAGDGSGYLPLSSGNFEKWITKDVPLAASEALAQPLSGPMFISGLSMGGFGAMRLGAENPGLYQAFSGHSSVTKLEELGQFVEEPLSYYQTKEGPSPNVLSSIQRNRENLQPFRFDCGTEDILLAANRKLHEDLAKAGISHVYEEFSGGHEWEYWESKIEKTLRFFSDYLPPQ